MVIEETTLKKKKKEHKESMSIKKYQSSAQGHTFASSNHLTFSSCICMYATCICMYMYCLNIMQLNYLQVLLKFSCSCAAPFGPECGLGFFCVIVKCF